MQQEFIASVKTLPFSVAKILPIVSNISGMNAELASRALVFSNKSVALCLKKIIDSCISNARQVSLVDSSRFFIKSIQVNKSMCLKRVKFHGRGRTGRVTRFYAGVRVVISFN